MTLWFESALTGEGWRSGVRVVIAGNTIGEIVVDAEPRPDDERHRVGLAGMPNLHSHAFQRAMAGLTECAGTSADTFWSWRDAMYRFVAALDPELLAAIAAMAYAEMLEAGFTRVGEFHYVHHQPGGVPYDDPAVMAQAIAAAAAETGIGLTLLPVFYAHADFGGVPATAQQRRFVTDLDGYARLLEASRAALADGGDAILGVAPHSLRAVNAAELTKVAALLPDAPIHIHVAEQTGEVEACLALTGQRPVEWLLDHAQVDSRWCLVHATHVSESEVDRMAASGAVVGLCPITEANLGDGIFPAVTYASAGGRFGIGSDSNVLISAAEELRLLEYGQRLTRHGRNLLALGPGRSTGTSLWDAAGQGGAQALGACGLGLAAGAPADLLALTGEAAPNALDAWIFAGLGGIDCVWRAGIKRVDGGRHIARDGIEQRYRDALRKITA